LKHLSIPFLSPSCVKVKDLLRSMNVPFHVEELDVRPYGYEIHMCVRQRLGRRKKKKKKKKKPLYQSTHNHQTTKKKPWSAHENLRRRLLQLTGQQTVPNVVIDGASVGGFDQVEKLAREGKLIPLLKKVGAIPE
jgi:glutaredoxin